MKNQNNVIEPFAKSLKAAKRAAKKAAEALNRQNSDLKVIKEEMMKVNIDCNNICSNKKINDTENCKKVCFGGLDSVKSVLADKLKA